MDKKEIQGTTVYEIVVTAKRIQGETADGRKYDFLTWTGYDKDGRKCKFKMVNGIQGLPKNAGEYVLKVYKEFINRDKKTRFNEYWVREIISCEPYEPHFEANVEDLPF